MPLDVDPNADYQNVIPDAIRRQSARADEIARAAGVANVPPPAEEPAQESPPEVVPTPSDPGPAPAPSPQPTEPSAEDWEQRYRTLQGKYDSEVPTLRADVQRTNAQISSLERVIGMMQDAPKAAPASEISPTVVTAPPEKDIEEYGSELIEAVGRWVQPYINKLEQRLAELDGRVGTVQTSVRHTVELSGHQAVMASLDADAHLGVQTQGPDGQSYQRWRVLNEDPQFLAWANQTDPLSAQQRLPLLRAAFDSGEAHRVRAIFQAYLNEQTVIGGSQAAPTHTSQETDGPTLESFATPGRASGPQAPAGAPSQRRVWSRDQITAFYRDVNSGKFANREVERLRLEQDLFAATREGRVQ